MERNGERYEAIWTQVSHGVISGFLTQYFDEK